MKMILSLTYSKHNSSFSVYRIVIILLCLLYAYSERYQCRCFSDNGTSKFISHKSVSLVSLTVPHEKSGRSLTEEAIEPINVYKKSNSTHSAANESVTTSSEKSRSFIECFDVYASPLGIDSAIHRALSRSYRRHPGLSLFHQDRSRARYQTPSVEQWSQQNISNQVNRSRHTNHSHSQHDLHSQNDAYNTPLVQHSVPPSSNVNQYLYDGGSVNIFREPIVSQDKFHINQITPLHTNIQLSLCGVNGCESNKSTRNYVPFNMFMGPEALFRSKAARPMVRNAQVPRNYEKDRPDHGYDEHMLNATEEEEKSKVANATLAMNMTTLTSVLNLDEDEQGSGIIPTAVMKRVEIIEEAKPVIERASYTSPDFFLNEEPITTPVLGDGAMPFPGRNVYAYCYPFNENQIVEKCSGAKDVDAVGVYVPMMMEIQMKHERSWYMEIRRLRRMTSLSIIGISYENPQWNLISDILLSNPQLFDGILIEWVGRNACISKMNQPTVDQLQIIKDMTRYGIIRYFVTEQNFYLCNATSIDFISFYPFKPLREVKEITEEWAFPRNTPEGFVFPPYMQPVFGCTGGHEGFCYKAFKNTPQVSCSSNQRYLFNPYEYVGGRMLHLFNESCHGLPEFDLLGVV